MILVTGGTGLVGSHLLVKLTSEKQKVRAIYRNKKSIEKAKMVFKALNAEVDFNKIEWVQADLLDYYSLENAFEGISHVYHAAAKVSFAAKDADDLMSSNIDGTANMVNVALDKGIEKLCYVSSVSALGSYANGKATDEEALWQQNKFTSSYSISKYYAENEVWRASEEGLDVVIVNPATIIGFGDWNDSSSSIIKKVYDGLSYYPSGGNGFVGVNDVVKSMLLLMESKTVNKRYLLVSENITFIKLFSLIANGFNKKPPQKLVPKKWANLTVFVDKFQSFLRGKSPVLTKESVDTAYRVKKYSSEKIKTELDFQFENMDQVIRETCDLYMKHN